MRELLVRYLLGELNPQEQEQLEAQLRDSPEMRRELDYMRSCFSGAADDVAAEEAAAEDAAAGDFDFEDADFCDADDDTALPAVCDAPRGLAERTLDRVCGDAPCEEITHSPAEIAAAYDQPTSTPSWSLADLTVAGGVFLAISMLFLPALRQSRDAARRTGCANNLREVGAMLVSYSETKGNFFPTPTRHENAGIYTVYLLEEGYAGADELSRLLLCRSSPIAEAVANKQISIRVPTMCELEAATAKERCMWKKLMSPSYAYLLGFVEGDRHCAVRNKHSCRKALLADAPCDKLNNLASSNHGGLGQNVLYHDGHVGYQKESTLPADQQDPIYQNDAGEEAAGLDRDDVVLGRSEAMPVVSAE
jgi:hypothetical protein